MLSANEISVLVLMIDLVSWAHNLFDGFFPNVHALEALISEYTELLSPSELEDPAITNSSKHFHVVEGTIMLYYTFFFLA